MNAFAHALRRGSRRSHALAAFFALMAAAPALAGVGGAAGPTWPATLQVGAPISAYVDIVNASDGVNAAEDVDVLLVTFTPSCRAATVGTCTTPDPGVFTLLSPAIGDPSTSCRNTLFNITGPTAAGVYTLSPRTAFHLGPANGSGIGANPPNPPHCRIVINANVSKLPQDSTPPDPPLTTIQFARAVLRGHTSLSAGSANGQGQVAITPAPGLAITKTDGKDTYTPGATTTYTIMVTNNGPGDALDVVVSDVKPAQITSWTWACSPAATGGATLCDGAASSAANFVDTINLPAGSTISYTVTAQINPGATGNLVNSVTATPAVGAAVVATDINTAAPIADLTVTITDGKASASAAQAP